MTVTIRRLDCENRVIKSYETLLESIKLGQSLVKFKVGSKTIGFDKIWLIKEVLSGLLVLVSVLRFFLVFMPLSVSCFKMPKSKVKFDHWIEIVG